MSRRALAVVALLLLPASAGAAAAAPGPTAAPPRFTLSALPGDGAERGWFVLPARPGDVLRRTVRLTNLSSRPTPVLLSAVDAETGPQGGVAYADADAAPAADGRWVTPQTGRVVLPPRGVRDVAVQVRVPRQARSGTHLAGLVARTEEPEVHTEQLEEGSAAVLQVHVRRVLAVEVHLPGDARAAVVPTGVRHEERATGPVLLLDARNTGNGLSPAEGTVRLTGPTALDLPVALGTTVPRTAFTSPLPLPRPLAPGRYTAQVVLRDPAGGTRQLQRTFEVAGEAAPAAPQRVVARLPLGGPAPATPPASPPASRPVVAAPVLPADPVPAAAVLAVALLLLSGFGLLGAVRDRRHAQRGDLDLLGHLPEPRCAP